jgi:2-keto-4-pentenoate hydratase
VADTSSSILIVGFQLIMTPVSYNHNIAVNERRKGGGNKVDPVSTQYQDQVIGRELLARQLVDARMAQKALPSYPGDVPIDLAHSYSIQDQAIALYPSTVIGWKVGLIRPSLSPKLGATRLSGPIFQDGLIHVDPARTLWTVAAPIFAHGSAAIEAEFVIRLGHDAPAGKVEWSMDEAMAMVGNVHTGIELAGSPVPNINGLGPCAVASDFGNNAGLVLGPEIADWHDRPLEAWGTKTWIDGQLVGTGSAASVPGTPFESLRYLLENLSLRGHTLHRGDWVSTGATTGVHDVLVGQRARIDFDHVGHFEIDIIDRAGAQRTSA